jgi:hypothetical protein
LFFLHLASGKVHVAGVTPSPHQAWLTQTARTVTMAEWGFLAPGDIIDDLLQQVQRGLIPKYLPRDPRACMEAMKARIVMTAIVYRRYGGPDVLEYRRQWCRGSRCTNS